eukprot:TRINITY_DN6235_c0_g1_i1.p1 TRINITY_DN6235_c0_g1~~TRINITY_DN6235_c0_g1_i1.p1  ORF type:complete len:771 (-),score=186.86 TRINITY_DN6235_c0_g1_i1:114-2426(-)
MDPLWKECLAWLDKFKVIPRGHPVLATGAGPHDLVLLLRDGVILCQLVHCLDPSSVDMTQVVYASPEAEAVSDFVCRNNIFLFLYAAVNNFQLDTDDHFFEPTALYQYKDISKVLRTLSALSHSTKFLASQISGFPKKEKKLEKKIQNEEQIYDSLRNYYNTVLSNNESIYSPQKLDPKSPIKEAEIPDNIYDDIYQTICSPRKSRMSLDISFSKKSKREYPIKEFSETEDKYLANLIMVRDNFLSQLQNLLQPNVVEIIFFRLHELITLHSDILLDLKKRKSNIGQVILKYRQDFEVYKDYCTNLSNAQAVLEAEEQRNPKLKKELNKCQIKAKSPFPLCAHIVLPFQRLLKYHIMLAEILKHTPETHEEYLDLELAHNHMKNFNSEVNEAKREQEDNEKQMIQDEKDLAILENVERTIKSMHLPNGAKLKDFGRLRRAGDLKVLSVSGDQTDYVFLLDTIMVMCNKPSIMQQRYRFKSALKLKEYRVEETRGGTAQNTIRLFHRMNLLSQPIILLAKSSIELDLWLKALLTSMDFLYPSENKGSRHDLIMTNLPALECTACKKKFLGMIAQGYRCRGCHAILHKSCIPDLMCREKPEPEFDSPMRRSGSIALPTFVDRTSMGSTLSLAPTNRSSSEISSQVRQLQEEWGRQQELTPLHKQDWFAGQIDIKTATDRIRNLPTGTFLVRNRKTENNEDFALDLKARIGVKHMKIYVESDENCGKVYSFSPARSFSSLVQLINYYRSNDLLENFGYKELEGVKLNNPYKSA